MVASSTAAPIVSPSLISRLLGGASSPKLSLWWGVSLERFFGVCFFFARRVLVQISEMHVTNAAADIFSIRFPRQQK